MNLDQVYDPQSRREPSMNRERKHRDAATGQFTTAEDAAARPGETVAEAVPARRESPDVAELRRLYSEWQETVKPYGFRLMPSGEYYALVAAAVSAVSALPALLDDADALRAELTHMTEARDNARAEVERLAARVERVRALHYAADNDVTRTPACETCHGKAGVHECGCWASEDRQPVCGHCNEGDKGISVAWPCHTIRIIDGGTDS